MANLTTVFSTQTNYSNFYTINQSANPTINPFLITNPNSSTPALQVQGDLVVQGKIKIKNQDLGELMQKIQDRLAILLEPDKEKLEQFSALKKTYEQYKILDALCTTKDDKC